MRDTFNLCKVQTSRSGPLQTIFFPWFICFYGLGKIRKKRKTLLTALLQRCSLSTDVITSKFDWMSNDIRTEKIISSSIWANQTLICAIIFFFEVSALLEVRHCSKLQSCAISRKTNTVTLRK